MPLNQILLIATLLIVLALAAANRLRLDVGALIIAATLGIMQLLGLEMLGPANTPENVIKIIAGFSQPVVMTLISLFIITRGLEKSGVTRWFARRLLKAGGQKEAVFIILFAASTALLSMFMNNLAAAALMVPGAMEVARQTRIKPSKLLIPVSYGSLLGGIATYFTTANIIISDLLPIASPPQTPLNILDFTPTGGLIAIAGILFLGLTGKHLLPNHEPSEEQALARLTGSELEDLYQISERLWETVIPENCCLTGQTLRDTNIGRNWGVAVAAIQRGRTEIIMPAPTERILPGDRIFFVGREEKIISLRETGLEITPPAHPGYLSQRGIRFTEVILAPHSAVEGQTLKQIDFRSRYGLTAIALRRLTRSYRTNVGDFPLTPGDSLLVFGTEKQVAMLQNSPNFIVIEPHSGDRPVDRKKAALSVTIITAAIAASIAGLPIYLCMLVGALLAILTGVINMEEAYRSIEWQAVFMIAGMVSASAAMVQTGLAAWLGQGMIALVAPLGPLGVAAGSFALATLLSQFMGGQVAALVAGPIAIAAAISMGVNPQAVAVATAIGCSTSFMTPMAHPVNVLMIGPANYTFADFFKIGVWLTLLSFIMLLVGLVVFWGL
ncbi:MAG TPA: SLC13 family permease [Anaerolineaceae bacterium]|nr:SLC13 family permease [Anaerolineaceae bacterium]HPN51454.1 SLC13 family permease [Anaerolineaceae bacterium]